MHNKFREYTERKIRRDKTEEQEKIIREKKQSQP